MTDYTVFFNEDRATYPDVYLEMQKIIFGPVVFQSTNILKKLGILEIGCKAQKKGLSESDFQQHTKRSKYGLKVLLEAALAYGIFTRREAKYYITKMGLALFVFFCKASPVLSKVAKEYQYFIRLFFRS